MSGDARYVIISADCHGGADLLHYRDYLPSKLHPEFDAWARRAGAVRRSHGRGRRARNWDHHRRQAELEADGIVAEVVFPNTIPSIPSRP